MCYLQADPLRDRLIGALVGLARAVEGNEHLITPAVTAVVTESLSAALNGGSPDALEACLSRVEAQKRLMVPNCFSCAAPCGRTAAYDMENLWAAEETVRSLKVQILHSLGRIAARPRRDAAAELYLYRALFAIGRDDWQEPQLLPIAQEPI